MLVLARFCEPSSELHIAEDWFRRTALGDLLGIADDKVNDDRLYRALDRVLPCQGALGVHLHRRLGRLFRLEYDLLLYDVTSTYFEGEAKANPQAQRGHSRDHRRGCKQVLIGLVVTRDGYPLGYEVFAGNRHDSTTVEQIVTRMEDRYGRQGRIWVLDRGMVSEATLAWLRGRGSRYIVGTPKSRLKPFAAKPASGRLGRGPRRKPKSNAVRMATAPGDLHPVSQCRPRHQGTGDARPFVARIRAVFIQDTRAACRPPALRPGPGSSVGWAGCSAATPGRQACSASRWRRKADGGAIIRWSRRTAARPGGVSARAAIPVAATWPTGTRKNCGRRTSILTDAEAAFQFKGDLQSGRCGTRRPGGCRRACWSASWPMCCADAGGLDESCGFGNSPTTVLEELARIQSTDVVKANDRREGRSGYGAWCVRTRRRPCCWNIWDSGCRSG